MAKEYFCKVVSNDYSCNLCIYIGAREGQDNYLLYGNELRKIDIHKKNEPTLQVSYFILQDEPNFLRALVDELIKFGIKPSEPIEDRSELKAVKYHLEDMRKLIFNNNPVPSGATERT